MSELWPRVPVVAWDGIPSGWLLFNLAYLCSLQEIIDRTAAAADGPRCVVQGCGAKVAWNQARTRLHHLEIVQDRHQPMV